MKWNLSSKSYADVEEADFRYCIKLKNESGKMDSRKNS